MKPDGAVRRDEGRMRREQGSVRKGENHEMKRKKPPCLNDWHR